MARSSRKARTWSCWRESRSRARAAASPACVRSQRNLTRVTYIWKRAPGTPEFARAMGLETRACMVKQSSTAPLLRALVQRSVRGAPSGKHTAQQFVTDRDHEPLVLLRHLVPGHRCLTTGLVAEL